MATKKLTRAQARSALGDMPERSFARLVSEGLPRLGKGEVVRFPWPEIWHWYVDRERQSAKAAVRPPDVNLAESERRESQAKAEIAELKAAQMRAELVPAALHRERITAFVGGFVAVVTGRLTRFERDIVLARTPADARKVTEAMRVQLMQGGQGYADTIEARATDGDAA